MERSVIWRVVQANVLEIVVTCFTGILEHGRLENRHAHSAHNARLWFPRVNEFRIDSFEALRQPILTSLNYRNLRVVV